MPQSKFMRFVNNSSFITATMSLGFMLGSVLTPLMVEDEVKAEKIQKGLLATGLVFGAASWMTAKPSGSNPALIRYSGYEDSGHSTPDLGKMAHKTVQATGKATLHMLKSTSAWLEQALEEPEVKTLPERRPGNYRRNTPGFEA